MQSPPEPHPLDFDWRFERETINKLIRLTNAHPILAVGTPQLARGLFAQGYAVQLVDRQPHLALLNAILLDIETAEPLDRSWMTAVLDPPWYPSVYRRWIGWAAQHIPAGGRILASLWPVDTRPTAKAERDELLEWASEWANCRIEPFTLRYEVPPFESIVRQMQGIPDPNAVWRKGDLLELRVRERPPLPPPIIKTEVWHRFVWNDYQLALRIGEHAEGESSISMHPLAAGWNWPSYSQRAIGRALIDLWSSRNEVAIVAGASLLKEELLIFTDRQRFPEVGSRGLQQLLGNWQIPSLPFQRSYSWVQNA